MKTFGTALIISAVLLLTGLQAEQKRDRKSGPDHTIRVEVDMVSLPVVVTTAAGKRILDLRKDDFRVYEDNTEQEIAAFGSTDEPVDVALLLDTSGSTKQELARIQNAAIDFTHKLHPDDEVAVLSFADDVRLQSDFSIDRDRNERGIKMTRTGEATALYEAVWLALEEVLKPVTERKALVLFTDGVDTRSRDASMKETLELSKETRATIYCVYYNTESFTQPTISIRPGIPQVGIPGPTISTGQVGTSPEESMRGRAYLKELAENSGGLVLDGKENLSAAFEEIARELASQYSLGYYPTNTSRDGKYRKIKIKMTNPDLRARTVKGYYAPGK